MFETFDCSSLNVGCLSWKMFPSQPPHLAGVNRTWRLRGLHLHVCPSPSPQRFMSNSAEADSLSSNCGAGHPEQTLAEHQPEKSSLVPPANFSNSCTVQRQNRGRLPAAFGKSLVSLVCNHANVHRWIVQRLKGAFVFLFFFVFSLTLSKWSLWAGWGSSCVKQPLATAGKRICGGPRSR